MSRLRKNVKAKTKQSYQGDFAQTFRGGLSSQTPFANFATTGVKAGRARVDAMSSTVKNSIRNAAKTGDKDAIIAAARNATKASFEAGDKASKAVIAGAAADKERKKKSLEGAADAAKDGVGGEDQIPSDTNYSREEVGAFFQRVKLAKEQDKLDADKAAAEAAAEAEKEKETEEGKNRPGGFKNDYNCDMTKAERKEEKRDNKGDIKDEKKACIKRGPGGNKRTCGLGRKNKPCRQHRKKCRQTKRGAMKENRQLNRATRKECKKQ
jgi:hypothetical protein